MGLRAPATARTPPTIGAWTPGCRTPEARERLARTSVVVLLGGSSSEREVSLVSGRAMGASLAGLEGAVARVREVEIEASGLWRIGSRSLAPHVALQRLPEGAVFFIGLHGGEGEDGRLQGFLELCGRAYTGSGPAASALCMDKERARRVFAGAGLRVASGATLDRETWRSNRAAIVGRLAGLSRTGWVVKPRHGGSSVATFVLDSPLELPGAIERVFATGDDALVEERIDGIETTVGVVGPSGGPLVALPPVEIVPRRAGFFDYVEKYSEDGADEYCPPRSLDSGTVERLCREAKVAYRAAGCEGYARIDFLVPREARAGGGGVEPVLLEANTLPGFTPRSLFPQSAEAVGVSFGELCLELCHQGLERVSGSAVPSTSEARR